jgi:hypothetical protein
MKNTAPKMLTLEKALVLGWKTWGTGFNKWSEEKLRKKVNLV